MRVTFVQFIIEVSEKEILLLNMTMTCVHLKIWVFETVPEMLNMKVIFVHFLIDLFGMAFQLWNMTNLRIEVFGRSRKCWIWRWYLSTSLPKWLERSFNCWMWRWQMSTSISQILDGIVMLNMMESFHYRSVWNVISLVEYDDDMCLHQNLSVFTEPEMLNIKVTVVHLIIKDFGTMLQVLNVTMAHLKF